MNIFWYIFIIAFHICVIIDAVRNIDPRYGAFRLILAFIPPLFGPMFYLISRTKSNSLSDKREFMKGKRRFS